jgi:outer membrane protein
MKNLSLVLNIVLLVAVSILYVLHFSGNKSGTQTASSDSIANDLTVAYIKSDSVLKYYDFFNATKSDLEKKAQVMEKDFENRYNDLQNEAKAYERNVNNMTFGQVQSVKENLAKKEQNLRMFQQSLQQKVMEEESKMNKQLYDRITVFLKEYSEKNGIQVVLKYDPTSDVLYGGKALDITKDVIEGLNTTYKAEATAKPEEKAK